MSTTISRGFRLALLQMTVGKNKSQNIETAIGSIRKAVTERGAKVVALPECFNSPYGTKYFPEYAEEIPNGETSTSLSNIAKELKIFVIGGTIPERSNDKLYNTCTVWSPEGLLLATYRKMHLFDIDIPGEITFKESEVLTGGSKFTVIEIDGCKIGLGVCYDIRFGELAQLYRNNGCDMLIYPGAFNMKTGPLHWELLARARATDNQVFVATISPARNKTAGYLAYGHSMIVDPWGKVLESAKEDDAIIVQDIDFSISDIVRRQIPVFSQRRTDLYDTQTKISLE